MTRLAIAGLETRLTAWKVRSLGLSLGFVIIGGLVYCARLGAQVRYPDEREYLTLAQNFADRHVYSLDGTTATAFRPPGYPILLGLLRSIDVPLVALRSLNVVFLAVTVWGVWWLAARMGGAGAATIAAPLAAVYPLSFYAMGTLYPQALASALLVSALILLNITADTQRPIGPALGCGILFGLLIVTVPTFALVLMLGVVWLFVTSKRSNAAVLVLAAALLIPLGWTVRNAEAMGSFIPIATNNGLNLLLGNSENSGPRTGVNVDLSRYRGEVQSQGFDEVQSDKYYRQSATDWILANPGRAAILYVAKTANYFAPFDQLEMKSEESSGQSLLAAAAYLPLLAILLVRLLLWRRDRPGATERLLMLAYLLSAPAQAVFFTRVRFRLPLDPLLIAIVAGFISRWLSRRSDPVVRPTQGGVGSTM
jgi:4-amino-4-deoxy-L-arabinose transferase-like glycosyltransferase